MIDSKPLETVIQGENLRFLSRVYKNKIYGRYTSVANNANKYRKNEEIAVRNFIKGYLNPTPLFNLKHGEFLSYKELLDYVKCYNPSLRISESSISNYKSKKFKIMKLQKTTETEAFVKYVKVRFKDFDETSFYILG